MGLQRISKGEKNKKTIVGVTHFFPSSTKESFNVLNAIVYNNFIVSPISLLSQNKPPQAPPTYSP